MISQGQCIAQVLPLPLCGDFSSVTQTRGQSQPGSSDVYWVQKLTETRPTLQLWLDEKPFLGRLDMGAYATVLSKAHWPQSWPLQATTTHLQGIDKVKTLFSVQKSCNGEIRRATQELSHPSLWMAFPLTFGEEIYSPHPNGGHHDEP